MNIKKTVCFCITGVVLYLPVAQVKAEDIKLPEVKNFGSMSLKETMEKRSTSRSFSNKLLSDNILSELLWAASGINRPDSGKRTAPTAINMQEIDIYVAMKKGLFLYDPADHKLKQVSSKDIRKYTGTQKFVAKAPVNLIYVADLKKMSRIKGENDKMLYASVDTGFIGQNVYLYCASKGLSTVFRGSVDKKKLAEKMGLKSHQKIQYSQTVGYPKK